MSCVYKSARPAPCDHHRPMRFAILPARPAYRSGYPHPECILGGWRALLTAKEQLALVDAAARRDGSTGFDALDARTRAEIRTKLRANREWERANGPIWFDPPSLDEGLVLPVGRSDAAQDAREWKAAFWIASRLADASRRRQVARMIVRDLYPVRIVIRRSGAVVRR